MSALRQSFRVDSHAHVYDLDRHPFHDSSGFHILPNEVGTAKQLACVLDAHGFTHALLVNPLGGYGTDNECLVEALLDSGGRFKGVALLEHGTLESEFRRLTDAGIIGLRFNLNFQASPSLMVPEAQRTLQLARECGWFVQIHYQNDALLDALPVLRRSGMPLVIDHFGRPDVAQGLRQPAFQALLELGREGGAAIKLSSVFRFGGGFPYSEADPFAHALIEAFGVDRCLWGSDWPFLRAGHRVDHASLLHAFKRWVPCETERERMLADNPARLFGWGPLTTD